MLSLFQNFPKILTVLPPTLSVLMAFTGEYLPPLELCAAINLAANILNAL